MKILRFSLLVFSLVLILISCSTSNTVKIAEECSNSVRVVVSTKQHIILEHSYQANRAAIDFAKKWCGEVDANSNPTLELYSCGSCCQSSYICK